MHEPCIDCLVAAMCKEACNKKIWQIRALRIATDQHMKAYLDASDKKSRRYYHSLYKNHSEKLNEARAVAVKKGIKVVEEFESTRIRIRRPPGIRGDGMWKTKTF